jgi:hypothetical protein
MPSRTNTFALALTVFACAVTDDATTSVTSTAQSETGSATSASTEATDTTGAADSTSSDETTTTTESTSESTTASTCPDVAFNYSVAYDPQPGNACDEVLGFTNTCAVTQVDCELEFFCNGAFEDVLPSGPIDASGVYVGEGMIMGAPVECTLAFTLDPHEFEFVCTGSDISCTGGGF